VLSTGAVAWSATLVQMNGDVVLGLHRCCARETRAGLVVGWTAAIAITGFSLISFGMGTLTLPMAVLMIVAAAMTPRPGATPTT